MKLLDIHANGGTCDRCGKGLKNVAVIKVDGQTKEVGLDCLGMIDGLDLKTKAMLKSGKSDARDLGRIKRAIKRGTLKVERRGLDGGIYFWKDESLKMNAKYIGNDCSYKYMETEVEKRAYELVKENAK